ncbi:hypothetical protein ACJRPK_09050 [Aquimarina sp. 2-A2]|uniref:hypothetical protein n=1 Tax=Aquimarina sp. 2-A2 TaxID=3382644 RepID=UPI00387EF893
MKFIFCLCCLCISFTSCKKTKSLETTIEYVQTEPVERSNAELPSAIGKWRLDSVVFIDNGIRGNVQTPFTHTSWIFDKNGMYIVALQQEQLAITPLQDSVKQKSSLTAEIPKQEFNGRYRQNENELITNILGSKTKYRIVKQSDTTLQLQSQRWQTPPISEKEAEQLAEHYFTFLQ